MLPSCPTHIVYERTQFITRYSHPMLATVIYIYIKRTVVSLGYRLYWKEQSALHIVINICSGPCDMSANKTQILRPSQATVVLSFKYQFEIFGLSDSTILTWSYLASAHAGSEPFHLKLK